jgi:hypothetical protein
LVGRPKEREGGPVLEGGHDREVARGGGRGLGVATGTTTEGRRKVGKRWEKEKEEKEKEKKKKENRKRKIEKGK